MCADTETHTITQHEYTHADTLLKFYAPIRARDAWECEESSIWCACWTLIIACINLCAYLVHMGCDFTKVGGGLWRLCSFMHHPRGGKTPSTH